MRKWNLLIFSFLITTALISQDTSSVLGFEEYMVLIKNDHPVSYQAKLLDDLADGRTRMSKGGFDPKVEGSWTQKSFDEKNYYSIFSGMVKVPTWFGIELKAGYENNQGIFLDQSDFIPSSGLWNAGITIPLGKGFILDYRRAELQKVELFRASTVQEQRLLLNNLYYQAAIAYLEWQINQNYFDIAVEGLALAENKFIGTRKSFLEGDKPAIDTLESFIAIQSRQQVLIQAEQDLENSKISINNFLWSKGTTPLELNSFTKADPFAIDLLKESVDSIYSLEKKLMTTHPELIQYNIKIDDLTVDRKLQAEDIKPDVRIAYNPLINTEENRFSDNLDIGNYKLGATASYPIFQREARGKVQMTEVKIKDTEFKLERKRQSLKVKLATYRNTIDNIENQVILQEETILNYQSMLDAENRKLIAGESSIFLVNNREQKYLTASNKRLSTQAKLVKNRLAYLYLLGQLTEIL